MKKQLTWAQYKNFRDEVWAKYGNDENLTHEARGKAIVAALQSVEIVK